MPTRAANQKKSKRLSRHAMWERALQGRVLVGAWTKRCSVIRIYFLGKRKTEERKRPISVFVRDLSLCGAFFFFFSFEVVD